MNALAHVAHQEVDHLRHMAATEPRRLLARIDRMPTTRVRQLLLLALSAPQENTP